MRRNIRTALATTAAAALTGGLLAVAAGTASAASGLEGDFNGDGYRDLAVTAVGATVNGQSGAGAVTILFGSRDGAGAHKIQTLSQNSAGVPGDPEKNDYFGSSVAAGDFNGDGYADLAVGSSGEDLGKDVDAGYVTVLWGSSGGLSGGTTVPDPSGSSHDKFGRILTAGDYNGDGKADLATASDSNKLDIFRGGFTKSGGTGGRYTVTTPVLAVPGPDIFNLTVGDVNNDKRADLVVDGYEKTGEQWNSNYYLPGSASGLTATGAKKLPAGIISGIGDTNGDGFGDIVIGNDWDATSNVPGSSKGGAIEVLYGSATGPSGSKISLNQDSPGVPGGSETGDGFGYELSLGDINGDGLADLAVGAPGEDLAGVADSGMVSVLYGAPDGFTTTGAQAIEQNTPGVPGAGEKGDGFGGEVYLTDTTGDGKADLAVGTPWENANDGNVTVFHSDGTKISTTAVSYGLTATRLSATGTPVLGGQMTG
ncbi:FG-GAP-like repeat-containing protein [Streptomyces sp. NBC_01465]|uniref:FG-GAP-like repeat-containing protein n=1 Tax=Streptomyces sp. NBC_01465 TaxID=2903878 RepID=UPI002E37ADE8|nr:FG-GAP-like repeat-containing protein [Streptomyces sp. NBC_01465]